MGTEDVENGGERPALRLIDSGPPLDTLRREALGWVLLLTSGRATAVDSEALDLWRRQSDAHGKALREAIALRRSVKAVAEAHRSMASDAAVKARPKQRLARREVLTGAVATASAVAGLMALYPPFGLWPSAIELANEFRADVHTEVGERRLLRPATGVLVRLNTRTSIALGKGANLQGFELISGEALIEIDRNNRHPITLVAGLGRITAGVASFNVRRDSGSVCVTCLAGAVTVAHGAHEVSLRSARQLILGETGLDRIDIVDASQVSGWSRGFLIFKNAPLAEVVAEINRYRSGQIILARPSLARTPVFGVFQVRLLEDAPADIRRLTGAGLTRLPGGIVLLT